ncbi:MAG TPA: 50S ribosomal protein L17 [Verrucomicrobiota bacterium]|nr:50S ribosomal protein L17 [Verrucomicrobiota bacterium]
MRHRIRTAKLGRTGEHRNAMLANMVCSLIEQKEITTTLAKAKAARVVAEKMVTLGKRGTLHHRRLVAARLRAPQRKFFPRTKGVSGKQLREQWSREHDVVRILFDEIAPSFQDRMGGYTRIIKVAGARKGDAAQMAILKWVDEPLEEKDKASPTSVAESASAQDAAVETVEAADASASEEEPSAEAEASAEVPAEESTQPPTAEESAGTDESAEEK